MSAVIMPPEIEHRFEIVDYLGAAERLATEHPHEWQHIREVLENFSFTRQQLLVGGGGKSVIAGAIDGPLVARGWLEQSFSVQGEFEGQACLVETHKFDAVHGEVALEVEWNNKEAFYDRDLSAFRILHSLGKIQCGVIVTRSSELQQLFKHMVRSHGLSKDKFVSTTTHLNRLIPRIYTKGSGDCPVLTFAIKQTALLPDLPKASDKFFKFGGGP